MEKPQIPESSLKDMNFILFLFLVLWCYFLVITIKQYIQAPQQAF